MRKMVMLSAFAATGLLSISVAKPDDIVGDDIMDRPTDKPLPRPVVRPKIAASAGVNRNTGQPHKHSREVARRLRQEAAVRKIGEAGE